MTLSRDLLALSTSTLIETKNNNKMKVSFTMITQFTDSRIPEEIRKAALFLVAYSVYVFLISMWLAVSTGMNFDNSFLIGIIRVGIVGYIALMLLSMKKIAWWLGISVSLLFSMIGIIDMTKLMQSGTEGGVVNFLQVLQGAIPLFLLGRAFILLSSSETKAKFI